MVKEKDDKCSFQVAGPLGNSHPDPMILQKWTTPQGAHSQQWLLILGQQPVSLPPFVHPLIGCGVIVETHSFTCSLSAKCQAPYQAMGITAASISPPTTTPALALPCLWAQDLPANTYTSFPEGSFWPFRLHFREIAPLSWPPPHPCPQPAAFHNSIPILFLPSGRITLRLVLQCPEFPGGMKKRLVPTVVAWLDAFLPISLPHPLPLLPGVTFHINYLHLDPGLRVCFCGNADQDRNTETEEFTDGDKQWGGGWSRSQGKNPERGPLTRPGSGQVMTSKERQGQRWVLQDVSKSCSLKSRGSITEASWWVWRAQQSLSRVGCRGVKLDPRGLSL